MGSQAAGWESVARTEAKVTEIYLAVTQDTTIIDVCDFQSKRSTGSNAEFFLNVELGPITKQFFGNRWC